MPLLLSSIPDVSLDISPEDAPEHLATFVEWMKDFFWQVSEESGSGGGLSALFVQDQIAQLPGALAELDEQGVFTQVASAVRSLGVTAVRQHGLFGKQLAWKISNVNHWLRSLVENPGAKIFGRLLASIDAYLESILDGVPGGGAIVELKELIGNSVELELADQ
jgi:hypothetical protein